MNDCITRDEFNNMIQSFHNLFLKKEAAEKIYIKNLNYQHEKEKLNIKQRAIEEKQEMILENQKMLTINAKRSVYSYLFSLYKIFNNYELQDYIAIIDDPKSFFFNDNQTLSDLLVIANNYYNNRVNITFLNVPTIYEKDNMYFIIPDQFLDITQYLQVIKLQKTTTGFSIILLNTNTNINNYLEFEYYLLTYNIITKQLIFKLIRKDNIDL